MKDLAGPPAMDREEVRKYLEQESERGQDPRILDYQRI